MSDPRILTKNRKELVEEMTDKFGYIFCESCQSSNGFKFECHHIVYRSEAPGHPNLHDKINLLIVCTECHTGKDGFHSRKCKRDDIVKKRGLDKIFEGFI